MRPFLICLIAFLCLGCASIEGPGSIASPNQGQVASQTSTVAPVSTQPLAAPGAGQSAGPGAAPAQGTTSQTVFAQPGQPSQDPLVAEQQSRSAIASDGSFTLQDFSTIEPNVVPGSDPFEGQRTLSSEIGTIATAQEQVEQSIEQGLIDGVATELLAAPAAPSFPRASLAPISTAPEPQATQLFDAIDDKMFDGGMQLVFFGDETAQFVVRSQVSAVPMETGTTVLYAFDVLDGRGNLRHRVSGTREVLGSGTQGWTRIETVTLQDIANEVANRLLTWFRANPTA